MNIILETERLQLREFTGQDASFILELLNTEDWLRYIGDRKVQNLKDAENYLENRLMPSYRQHGFGFYYVGLRATGRPVGMCGLVKRAELEDIDIGFAFLPAYFGKGYAYESAKSVLEYAFVQLKQERICAVTLAENRSSVNLLKKLGLHYKKQVLFGDPHEELMLFEAEAVKNI